MKENMHTHRGSKVYVSKIKSNKWKLEKKIIGLLSQRRKHNKQTNWNGKIKPEGSLN